MKTSAQKKNDDRLRRLRQMLHQERTRTYQRIRELRNEQRQDATPAPGDELDKARSLSEVETHAGLIERAEYRLKAIDAALSGIDRNRYDLCEACGQEIPVERLQALPFTAYCIECQRKRNNLLRPGQGVIDEASNKLWAMPTEMEAQDALVEPEERLFVHDRKPFGSELGEFEQQPGVATARRRGRVKRSQREH